jgi:glutathione S-transferase
MITLIQFSWSPFCITVRRILERHRIAHRIRNISADRDRSVVIRATKGRGYSVPCVVDGKTAVVDLTPFGQEVARHVDHRYRLGLFPRDQEGIQLILAQYIENQLEEVGFRVNDSYIVPTLPLVQRVMLFRYKERKFGKGCLAQWTRDRVKLNRQFGELLKPMDNVLASSEFLIADRPLFVDYDLFGIVENYLFNGKTKLPALRHLQRWHRAMSRPPSRTRSRR